MSIFINYNLYWCGILTASYQYPPLFLEIPEIQKDPEDITVNFGEAVMFTCVVTGDPTPDIIWLRDSNEIPIDGTRYEVMDNGTLMLHDISESDTGYFECMAKNQVGEVHSKPARMTVQKEPNKNGNDLNTSLSIN